MSRAFDRYECGVRDGVSHQRGRFHIEDIAQPSSKDQGRTGNRAHRVSEVVRIPVQRHVGTVFPYPPAVLSLLQVVADPVHHHFLGTEGIDRAFLLERRLDRVETGTCRIRSSESTPIPRQADGGRHVYRYQAFDPLGVSDGKGEGVVRAHGKADQGESLDSAGVGERTQVTDEVSGVVGGRLRPLGVSVTPLVERDDPVAGRHCAREGVPHAGVTREPVKQHHGRSSRLTPQNEALFDSSGARAKNLEAVDHLPSSTRALSGGIVSRTSRQEYFTLEG